MINEKNFKKINIEIICIYLTIACSVLYLIIYYKERAILIDKYCGKNYNEKYPDTTNYNKIIVIIFTITNTIFLYYAYEDLKNNIIKYKKTGNDTGLNSSYNSFLANILEYAGTLIVLYNVFENEDSSINSLL
jgi:hypothetical protein